MKAPARNTRRLDLIEKERTGTLTAQEQAELLDLQVKCSVWLNDKHPLDFEKLKAIAATTDTAASTGTEEGI